MMCYKNVKSCNTSFNIILQEKMYLETGLTCQAHYAAPRKQRGLYTAPNKEVASFLNHGYFVCDHDMFFNYKPC